MTERILLPATIIKDPKRLHDLDLPPNTIAVTAQGEALQSVMRNFELTEIDYPLIIIRLPHLSH